MSILPFRIFENAPAPLATFVAQAPQILSRPDPTDVPRFILSFDGGGMCTVVILHVLEALEQRIKAAGLSASALYERSELLAGTSAGSIIASALRTPLGGKPEAKAPLASDLLHFFTTQGPEIFGCEGDKRKFSGRIGDLRRTLARGGVHDPAILRKNLENLLGANTAMSDIPAPLLVAAYNQNSGNPVVFASDQTADDSIPPISIRGAFTESMGGNFKLVDVVMASAAAPTFFPPQIISSLDGQHRLTCLDGICGAGDPSLAAYLHFQKTQPAFAKACQLVSLGCGEQHIPEPTHRFSAMRAIDWVTTSAHSGTLPVIESLKRGTEGHQRAALHAMMGERFHRIDAVTIEPRRAIDDATPSGLAAFQRIANTIITEQGERLDALAAHFVRYARPPEDAPEDTKVMETPKKTAKSYDWRGWLGRLVVPALG